VAQAKEGSTYDLGFNTRADVSQKGFHDKMYGVGR
jgi:hypothetical protein